MRLPCLALTLALAALPSLAHASASAAQTFETKHAAVLALVSRGASAAELGQRIDAMLGYAWLAETSLGGPGNHTKVCGDRCAEFENLLTELIRENYIRMARESGKHPVEFVGHQEGRNGLVKITTKVE